MFLIIATNDIPEGDGVFLDYGEAYWQLPKVIVIPDFEDDEAGEEGSDCEPMNDGSASGNAQEQSVDPCTCQEDSPIGSFIEPGAFPCDEVFNPVEKVPLGDNDTNTNTNTDKDCEAQEEDGQATTETDCFVCQWIKAGNRCVEQFSSTSELQKHVETHIKKDSTTKTLLCYWQDCKRKTPFTKSYGLRIHLCTHTGEKPYECKYKGCRKAFSDKSTLYKHRRTHTGEKPYKCKYKGCGKAFSDSSARQIHRRTHTGEKPYKCEHEGCDKAYPGKSALLKHRRTHTGEKPYECQYCDKTFAQSGHLLAHERTHTGKKPYECQYCDKTFAQSGHLLAHERTHTGEKPYKCERKGCGKTFSNSSHLRRHQLTCKTNAPGSPSPNTADDDNNETPDSPQPESSLAEKDPSATGNDPQPSHPLE